jgi:hypothetical protein
MSSILTLSQSHLIQNGYNNTFRYELSGSSVNFKDAEVAVASIQLYNSQFNINSSNYSNNLFSIIIPTAATTSTISINLRDGLYNYSDMNKYIQQVLISSGAYLVDSNGKNVYYIQLTANSVFYCAQVDVSPVPISLPVGWTRPATGLYSSGGSGLPSTAYVPQLVIPANFNSIIGFAVGTFPSSPSTTAESFLSTIAPQINPVSCYLVRCNLINNEYSTPPDVITSFTTQGTASGDLIDYKPNEYAWLSISDSVKSYIEIIICDNNFGFVQFNDPAITIQLLIRSKK